MVEPDFFQIFLPYSFRHIGPQTKHSQIQPWWVKIGLTHLHGEVSNSTWQDILLTLTHSLTHCQVNLTCVVTCPTQPIQNIPEQSSPPFPHLPHLYGDFTNSTQQDILVLLGQPSLAHLLTTRSNSPVCSEVTNSALPKCFGTIRSPSLTHLLTTRTNSPVWWRHQLNRAGYFGPSGQPYFTHILTTRSTSPVWWRHQLNRAGYSGTIRSTLLHSRTNYQVNLACVVTTPTQTGRIFWYHQFNLLSLTYSLPGVWWRHKLSQVEFYGTIMVLLHGELSITQLLTTRLTSSVWWCNGPSRARYSCTVIRQSSLTHLLTTRPTSPVWWRHQLSRAGYYENIGQLSFIHLLTTRSTLLVIGRQQLNPPEYSKPIRLPSLTHLLTTRSTSSVSSCHQLN